MARSNSDGARPDADTVLGLPRSRALLIFGAALVLLHLLLALAAFNRAPHSGGDNAGYISLAHSLLSDGSYTEAFDPLAPPHTKYPPVFPAILALWIAAGARTWVALKTPALVFSTLSVLFAYLWASERRGPLFGLAVGLLFAGASALIDISHWELSDPPFVAFTFLALWAVERSERARSRPGRDGEVAGGAPPSDDPSSAAARSRALFLAAGLVASVLAYFTRSAGLPLLIALAAWLALGRRWKPLIAYAAGAGPLLALWAFRAMRHTRAGYVSEFWLVDPYDPSRGNIGVGGLVGRVLQNLLAYTTRFVPGGIVGVQTQLAALLGVALVALALLGWLRATRRPGVAELMLPLYVGLILVWPEVWSGDRFALPLYPLLFLYAGDSLRWMAAGGGRPLIWATGAIALLLVGAPEVKAWTRAAEIARGCNAAVRAGGPFACWGPGVEEFVNIALWSREALPPGSAVLSRKPRIFYVMSGIPSRTFPFSIDADDLFEEAEAANARYVLIDQWDRQALRFVGEAVSRRTPAFCVVGGFDPRAGSAGTLLLGILPNARSVPDQPPGKEIVLERCPPDMIGDVTAEMPTYSSSEVPLLSSSSSTSPDR